MSVSHIYERYKLDNLLDNGPIRSNILHGQAHASEGHPAEYVVNRTQRPSGHVVFGPGETIV